MCFAWISEQTAIISLYSINLSVFKNEAESVYCAVRNGSLNQTDSVSYLRVKIHTPPFPHPYAYFFIGLLQLRSQNKTSLRYKKYWGGAITPLSLPNYIYGPYNQC